MTTTARINVARSRNPGHHQCKRSGEFMCRIVIGLALTLVAVAAWAESLDQNMANCMSSDPTTSISGCSAVIQSGKLTGLNLAVVYVGRGFSYNNKGLHDQAIADFAKAIAIAPNDPKAYVSRGITYEMNGQRDRAIADYRTAMKINPNDNNSKLALKRLSAPAGWQETSPPTIGQPSSQLAPPLMSPGEAKARDDELFNASGASRKATPLPSIKIDPRIQ